MYIDRFVAGVLFTILAEFGIVFIYVLLLAIFRAIKSIFFKGDEK